MLIFLSILYIADPEAKIGFVDNRVVATYSDGMEHSLPVESVESITLLTKVQLSTKCMEQCLKRGIPVAFFSKGGRYFGRLVSTGHINAALQRQKSCFEVIVSASSFDKMLKNIAKYCDNEDSIRVYRLQGKSQVYQWGTVKPIEEEEVVVL